MISLFYLNWIIRTELMSVGYKVLHIVISLLETVKLFRARVGVQKVSIGRVKSRQMVLNATTCKLTQVLAK